MTKVVLKGPSGCQWDLGEGFRDAGVPLELSTKELVIAKRNKMIENELDTPKVEPKKVSNTEDELYAMNKDEQVALLKELGITTIPRLEKDRVKAILEAQ